MTLSFTTANLRDKLGNTIQSNFQESFLEKAVEYGVSELCRFSRTVKSFWTDQNPYWGSAVGIAMDFAVVWCRSTQLNVSIQMMREWQKAREDAEGLYATLLAEGLIKTGTSFFVTDEFQSDVLNPLTGTSVTGLKGIVRRNRLIDMPDTFYVP